MAMQSLLSALIAEAKAEHHLANQNTFGLRNGNGNGNGNGNSLLSHHLVAENPSTELVTFPNGCIAVRNRPNPIPGQLGLGQCVTRYRQTLCSENRVGFQNSSGQNIYNGPEPLVRTQPQSTPFPVSGVQLTPRNENPNQPWWSRTNTTPWWSETTRNGLVISNSLPMGSRSTVTHHGVHVTEVVRECVYTVFSSDGISIPDHNVDNHNQSILKTLNPGIANPVPLSCHMGNPIPKPEVAPPPPQFMFDEFEENPPETNVQVFSDAHSSLCSSNHVEAASVLRKKCKVKGGTEGENTVKRRYPTNKNGPYKCLKCGDVFETSPYYAAHCLSHYRTEETIEERKKRQELKKMRKHRRMVLSSDGAAIVLEPNEVISKRTNIPAKGRGGRKPNPVEERDAVEAVKKEPAVEMVAQKIYPKVRDVMMVKEG